VLFDDTEIIKDAFEDMKRLAKSAVRNVSNTFTVAGRSAYLYKGTTLKEIMLK
jgi:3-methyladenine DNA glycosylase AlkD